MDSFEYNLISILVHLWPCIILACVDHDKQLLSADLRSYLLLATIFFMDYHQ